MTIKQISVEEWSDGQIANPARVAELPLSIEEALKIAMLHVEPYYNDGLGEYLTAFAVVGGKMFILEGPTETTEIGALVSIHGNDRDPEFVLNELCTFFGLKMDELPWVSEYRSGPKHCVYRLDDNDNEVEMERFYMLIDAESYAHKFEMRGHKQTYTIKSKN